MAKFKYRMEPVLKLRKLEQDQEERKVARCISEFLNAQTRLKSIQNQIEQHYNNIRNGLFGNVSPQTLAGDRVYLNHLHGMRYAGMNELTKAKQKVDQAKSKLAEAKKRADAVKKLKERSYKRFIQQQKRLETLELDDISNGKYAWSVQSSGEENR